MQFKIKKPDSPDPTLQVAIRQEIAKDQQLTKFIESPPPTPNVEPAGTKSKRVVSQLVDDDFPFDPSQLYAIEGLTNYQYGCLTGAAGTGKTTTTKKLVDTLKNTISLGWVDMATYFKQKDDEAEKHYGDDYEIPEDYIPSIALVSFTGRATQQIKKNFPRDWHANIMTIHRALAFAPEWYDDWDEDAGGFKKKLRFTPGYTADNLMPWDIIIIDEAGMLGLDLWKQLFAACRKSTRIYMIGDINQLPPVHGKSVFGFALAKWPAFELTEVHRQKDSQDQIVPNAWRVLRGQLPKSEGNFQMIQLKGDAAAASRLVRGILFKCAEELKIYDPIRDTVIVPINGADGSRGYELGQLKLNEQLAIRFNPASEHPRYTIDGGREKRRFAVGDKVMATKNDHEAGITNGMTGIITGIVRNEAYDGEAGRFGTQEEINAWMEANEIVDDDDFTLTLEDIKEDFQSEDEQKAKEEAKAGRGPASHIVTVEFGEDNNKFEMDFVTLSEVHSLMTAYVVTCHKMQGGESPVIIIVCHDAHASMLYREWLYTAITRASQKVILLYTGPALKKALNKQSIKGSTLAEKIKSFNDLQKTTLAGKTLQTHVPDVEGFKGNAVEIKGAGLESKEVVDGVNRLEMLLGKAKSREAVAKPLAEPAMVADVEVTVKIKNVRFESQTSTNEGEVIDAEYQVVDQPSKVDFDAANQDGRSIQERQETRCLPMAGDLLQSRLAFDIYKSWATHMGYEPTRSKPLSLPAPSVVVPVPESPIRKNFTFKVKGA